MKSHSSSLTASVSAYYLDGTGLSPTDGMNHLGSFSELMFIIDGEGKHQEPTCSSK